MVTSHTLIDVQIQDDIIHTVTDLIIWSLNIVLRNMRETYSLTKWKHFIVSCDCLTLSPS